jgi:glycosyltransferase involved in cell wall biosynthesis
MNLLLVFDHRFFRTTNGEFFSKKGYRYEFFASRYLQVFDRIHVLCRVGESNELTSPVEVSDGPGVKIVPVGDWTGPVGFLRNRGAVLKIASRLLEQPSAVLMIVPGGIGSLLFGRLRNLDYPIALEVVGDPWDAFQPGAIKHPLRPLLRRHLARNLRRQCGQACAVSYVTSHSLQARYPCPGYSVGISDVVLSDSSFAVAPRIFEKRRKWTIACVGVMNGYKGHDVLLDAFAICRNKGIDLRLVLIGGGPLQSEIEKKVQEKNLSAYVRCEGQLHAGAAVEEQLDRADLFVLPSRQEGLPRAMVEAMARGLPCIGTAVGGIPELLGMNELVPPNDPLALAGKIEELTQDPERLSTVSLRNLSVARSFCAEQLQPQRFAFYSHIKAETQKWLNGVGNTRSQ